MRMASANKRAMRGTHPTFGPRCSVVAGFTFRLLRRASKSSEYVTCCEVLILVSPLPWLQPRLDGTGSRSGGKFRHSPLARLDRKSTRLNSSHLGISYAV